MTKWLGAVSGLGLLIGVALGALAAHGLRTRLSPDMLNAFETGVRYQIYHALALGLTALLAPHHPLFTYAGLFYTVGIVLFSFSLYGLALTGIRWLGIVTPLGGVAFLVGHALLATAFFRARL